MPSGVLLSRYLDKKQLLEITDELTQDLYDRNNVDALADILDFLDDQSKHKVFHAVRSHFVQVITSNEDLEALTPLHQLLQKLPDATQSIVDWIYNRLLTTITSRSNFLFSEDALKSLQSKTKTHIPVEDIDEELTTERLIDGAENLFTLEGLITYPDLDRLILIALMVKDETVSNKASKALKWRSVALLNEVELIWEILPVLLSSDTKFQNTNGFILWLRFLLELQKTSHSTQIFRLEIQKLQYWTFIQNGLTSSVHEQKKYSLSILKLSIQLADVDIDNELITLNLENKAEKVEQWKRFSTLYEIVGIDTALNQAEAARNDILLFLSPNSYIRPSWTLALLCTGFKASSESVRKFALGIMFEVPKKNLSIFAHEFLTSVFLKYALEASHFNVKNIGGELKCEYGERLESFIRDILKALKSDESKFRSVLTSLLTLLVDMRLVFAPARIYLSSGILKGLSGSQVLCQSDLTKLYKLFESTAEDELFEKTLQSIHLLFLNHIQSDISLLLESLTRFVQINGYEIFKIHIETFLDYVSVNFDKTIEILHVNKSPEYQVIYYSLSGEHKTTDEFLKELAISKIKPDKILAGDLSVLLTKLIKNEAEAEEYHHSQDLVDLEIFSNSWKDVDLKPLFKSLSSFDRDRLSFFSAAYSKFSESISDNIVVFEELVELSTIVIDTQGTFKEKDAITSSYLQVILNFLKMSPITNEQVTELLLLIQKLLKFAVHHTFTLTCKILQNLLSNYEVDLITVVEILEGIWDHVSAERLVLNQRDMHLTFIETIFHESMLKDTVNNEYNGGVLLRVGLEIVQQSYIRRSLVPRLTTKLLQYSSGYKREFEQTTWIQKLLLKALQLTQDQSNLFRIKTVIARKYDSEITFEGDLYSDIYGIDEISAKVNVISILASSSQEFADEYLKSITENDQCNLIVPKKKADGHEEIERLYGFASLLLVSRRVSAQLLSNFVDKTLLPLLESESSPLVRSYIEWIIAIDMIQSEANRGNIFSYLKDQNKPTLVVSAERVAFLVAQSLEDQEARIFLVEFISSLIPNCASGKPLIRHFSNSLILSLYPLLQAKGIELPINNVLRNLYIEAKKSESTGKFRSGDALVWDAIKDFNLSSIFGGILSKISSRELDLISEEDLQRYISPQVDVDIGSSEIPNWKLKSLNDSQSVKLDVNSPLQTKSGAWETVLDLNTTSRSIKRTELIVVSSLVDKPPNLGGICRLCDVLGAKLMTVDDLRVKNHPQFKNVSVTADHWMPITEVKIPQITDFMRLKKKEGYTLIGLEQTDKSIVLSKDTEFPEKSLILLGKEAEGIPGELLCELDYCIEIRQLGVIRSMNIQTAAAVIVHAYSSSQKI